jgi:hypothetical protein
VNIAAETITWNDAIHIFEKATGKTFEKVPLTVEALKKKIAENPNPWGTIVEQLQLVLALGAAELTDVNYQKFIKNPPKLLHLSEFAAQLTSHK